MPPLLRLLAAVLLAALTPTETLRAQPFPAPPLGPEGYRPGLEIAHYAFDLEVFETTDTLRAQATVRVRFTADTLTVLPLDLVAEHDGRGMRVEAVAEDGHPRPFRHRADRLEIVLAEPPAAGTERTYTVAYAGVPADGLVIGENRHGRRTFFGDNWPNRARHWLPTVDHPSSKAPVTWTVTVPSTTYDVVANGRRAADSTLADGRRRVRYVAEAPIPTKVAVFGAAPFAVETAGEVDGVPVESWVYEEDREAGFADFGLAVRVLEVFTELLGPYPFEKLANVQSTTRYGGMENAGAIFYDEASLTGTGAIERLIAHEVAHQWFGNAVTEADWPHLWLSEGFATYLAHVYAERVHGEEARAEGMARDRARVAAFAAVQPGRPVVDSAYVDPTALLNPNSYQKGAWVLHLLRRHLGDEPFFEGLRAFYARHRDGHADTEAFRRTMEETSGRDLEAFFAQWLHRPGIPRLAGSWRYADGTLTLQLRQTQPGPPFAFPLDVAVRTATGIHTATLELSEAAHAFELPLPAPPAAIVLDPDVHALFAVDAFDEED